MEKAGDAVARAASAGLDQVEQVLEPEHTAKPVEVVDDLFAALLPLAEPAHAGDDARGGGEPVVGVDRFAGALTGFAGFAAHRFGDHGGLAAAGFADDQQAAVEFGEARLQFGDFAFTFPGGGEAGAFAAAAEDGFGDGLEGVRQGGGGVAAALLFEAVAEHKFGQAHLLGRSVAGEPFRRRLVEVASNVVHREFVDGLGLGFLEVETQVDGGQDADAQAVISAGDHRQVQVDDVGAGERAFAFLELGTHRHF